LRTRRRCFAKRIFGSQFDWHGLCVRGDDKLPGCAKHTNRFSGVGLALASAGYQEKTAMQFMERSSQRGLWYEEMNRARQEIQGKWTEAERSHRRQLAECRQQALARALMLIPENRARARQLA
jgi:hypothetical protein